MRSGDFASGPGSGKALQLAPKIAAFPGQRLVVTASYNRLESDAVFAGSPPADSNSMIVNWRPWFAERSA
jgi:hypothetical protein